MQVRHLVIVVAGLAVGTVARAESIVPCNFVDDFCVAPSHPDAGAVAAAAESERRASAAPLIPSNFVDDFGVEAGRADAAAPTVAVPSEPGRSAGPAREPVARH